jgi:hypothetical protein
MYLLNGIWIQLIKYKCNYSDYVNRLSNIHVFGVPFFKLYLFYTRSSTSYENKKLYLFCVYNVYMSYKNIETIEFRAMKRKGFIV